MPLLVAALLGLTAAILVLRPLFAPAAHAVAASGGAAADLAARERSAKDALRELDFDYHLGNLEASDYKSLRQRYEEHAVDALQARYSHEQQLDALIDRELEALRARETRVSSGNGRAGKSEANRTSDAAPARRSPGAARRRRGGSRG